jgi:hypothetical protein
MRIGFLPLLAVTFIVLRLCEVITWSWWWVLAPIWIPLLITALASMVFGVICFAVEQEKRHR